MNAAVRSAAAYFRWPEIAVVGSMAVYGCLDDSTFEFLFGTDDVDLFPFGTDITHEKYIDAHAELGDDSEFHQDHGFYVDTVRRHVPRLPAGWEQRAVRRPAGSATIGDREVIVTAVFPEIHDLTASKVALSRPNDIRFLEELAKKGLIQRDKLLAALGAIETSQPAVDLARRNVGRAFGVDPSPYEFRGERPR